MWPPYMLNFHSEVRLIFGIFSGIFFAHQSCWRCLFEKWKHLFFQKKQSFFINNCKSSKFKNLLIIYKKTAQLKWKRHIREIIPSDTHSTANLQPQILPILKKPPKTAVRRIWEILLFFRILRQSCYNLVINIFKIRIVELRTLFTSEFINW